MKRGNRLTARQVLGQAQRLDSQNQNHAGLARTHELIGDLHRPREDRRNAALTEYGRAEENYERADMYSEVRAVRRKIDELNGVARIVDGWWTHALDRCARSLVRLVEKRRDRAQMKAALIQYC
jgi:hypothetical protein